MKKQLSIPTHSYQIRTISAIEAIWLRGEWHLPGHNFTGPGTQLEKRLERGDEPINRVDALSLHHDIRYQSISRESADDGLLNFNSDYEILNADLNYIGGTIGIFFSPSSSPQERIESVVAGTLMSVKVAYNFLPVGRSFSKFKRFQKNRRLLVMT